MSETTSAKSPREAQPESILALAPDELTAIELKIAESESELKNARQRLRFYFYIACAMILIGFSLILFGKQIPAEGNFARNAPLYGIASIVYGIFFVSFSSFIAQSRIASLQQELEVLNAKRRILTRSTPTPESTSEQQSSMYFDRLVDINVTNLGAYYGLIKVHTSNSFVVSIVAGGIGFILIITGLIIGFTNNANSKTITYVASGSGIITEFIAGIFFYLYNRTVRQMKDYHDSLLSVQNILLSFKIVGDTRDEAEKVKMVSSMLAYLVGKQIPSLNEGISTGQQSDKMQPPKS